MKRIIRDQLLFLKQVRRRYTTTGAIAPSSRFLAAAMTAPLRKRKDPVRILEVGPGTGAVTRRIVTLLKPGDRFDLVELNEAFVELLKKRFREDPSYRAAADQSEIHVCPLQEFQSEGQYDFIISGLPLNNFSSEMVGEIFDIIFRLLAPGGVLSYFEYMYIRKLRGFVSGNSEKQRLRELEDIMNSYLTDHCFQKNWVFVNFPPAWVQHLRREPEE